MSACTKTYSKGSCDIKTEKLILFFWLLYKVYVFIKYRGYHRFVVFCGSGAQETAVGLIEPSFEMLFQSRCLTSNLLAEKEAFDICIWRLCCQHLWVFFKLQMFSLPVSEVIYQTASLSALAGGYNKRSAVYS